MTDVMYEISMWRQLGGKDQGQLQMKLQSMLKQDNETEVYSFAPFDLPVSAMNFDAGKCREPDTSNQGYLRTMCHQCGRHALPDAAQTDSSCGLDSHRQ